MTRERPHGPIVAIDGPAGSGKSTLARRLATEVALPYVNTGLMYRALTARALSSGIHVEDEERLATEAGSMVFAVREGQPPELTIEGVTALGDLTSRAVEENVSTVSRHPAVRRILRQRQRALGASGSVMEGRDIGSVVFPDADVKIFLSAAPDVRADRRGQEEGRGHLGAAAVGARDALDARTNPLVPAEDAFVVDTTSLSPDEVFAEVLAIVDSRIGGRDVPVEREG